VAIFGWWKRKTTPTPETGRPERGFLVFDNTSEVIRAMRLLNDRGWAVRVMGPPPQLRRGCDLVIEFPLVSELEIMRVLKDAGAPPLQAVPATDPLLQPVNLFQVKDFGSYLMVRAANMKLTVDKATRTIVNISGGGCPDVPYLAREMISRTMAEAPQPKDIGHTLCGYALQLAWDEMERQCSRR
jgi:hypothetical protein